MNIDRLAHFCADDLHIVVDAPYWCACCERLQPAGPAVDSYAFQAFICDSCDESIFQEGNRYLA